jgi:lipopolysaccharide transport system permease protein
MSPPAPITVIEPPRGWIRLNLAEVWQYRDLLTLLIWRDISARYRQSVVGYGWAIIKPVVSMLIFTVIFGNVAKLPSDGAPYALFTFSALLPWMYFSTALSSVTTSIVGGGGMLTKVYFPRLVLPLASVGVGVVDFLIQSLVLVVLMAWYRHVPGWQIVFVPLFVLLCIVTALAFGLWLTALNVKYRDVGMAVPFLVQAWMWLCPIVYPSRLVPDKWRAVYGLNPMVGVIEGFRWSLLGTDSPDWRMMTASFMVVAFVLLGGLYWFRKVETTFADVI